MFGIGNIRDFFIGVDARLKTMESRFSEIGYDFRRLVVTEMKKRWKFIPQNETYFGAFTALCVDTKDPRWQNRVRFFSPHFNKMNAQVEDLEWANPISSMGGFDDCGLSWVPPAGSQLVLVFERGSKNTPYYIGTTWARDRGPNADPDINDIMGMVANKGGHNWNYVVPEWDLLYKGKRASSDKPAYFIGPNDESQDFPQWNTDNYQHVDTFPTYSNLSEDVIQEPNNYGMKTPQKHMLKFVDGYKPKDYKWKRIEILSSLGNWMLFKDDYWNKETWPHPDCGTELGENKFFKHTNECWPYKGPGTPQNNHSALPNTGIQFMSRSGHTIILDDHVQGRPAGVPEWQRTVNESFDFAELYLGKIKIITTTGHRIEGSDKEDKPENRGPDNYLRMLTACGNIIELNDHTIMPNPETEEKFAGWKRGITMQSTSRHRFEMIDYLNKHYSPPRMEITKPADESEDEVDWESRPKNEATAAYVRLRTGYGLQLEMNDAYNQQKTDQQFIEIYCPFITCPDCGPHFMRFQELCDAEGQSDGYVFLRVAGTYYCVTCKDHITIVGDPDEHPSDKVTIVTKDTLIDTEEYYMNVAQLHFFLADELILLLAGKDCPVDGVPNQAPCVMPILMMNSQGQVVASDRVYGSASEDAYPVSIFNLFPFPELGNND